MDFLAFANPFTLENVQNWFEWGGYFILFGLLFACGDQRHTLADTGKIRRHLGWEARTSLEEGLARQWEWQRHGVDTPRCP